MRAASFATTLQKMTPVKMPVKPCQAAPRVRHSVLNSAAIQFVNRLVNLHQAAPHVLVFALSIRRLHYVGKLAFWRPTALRVAITVKKIHSQMFVNDRVLMRP